MQVHRLIVSRMSTAEDLLLYSRPFTFSEELLAPQQGSITSLTKRLEEASNVFQLSLNVQQFVTVHETNAAVHDMNVVLLRIDDRTYRTG